MTRKIFIYSLLVLFAISSYASTNKLALELARAKKIDTVVQRVNNIYEFINVFIMEKAIAPNNFEDLENLYSGLINDGFTTEDSIDFSISDNIVTFTQFVPNSIKDSHILNGVLKNNIYLSPNAMVTEDLNTSTTSNDIYQIIMTLKSKSLQFLKVKHLLLEHGGNNISIQDSNPEPSCNDTSDRGKTWYRPDGMGGFYIKFCIDDGGYGWKYATNKIENSIISANINTLKILKPIAGTKAYIPNTIDNNVYNEYIYIGDDGDDTNTDWKEVKTN